MPPTSICCCCLKEGCYKTLYTEYYNGSQIEIYEQMLKETLNIKFINTVENGQRICDTCIDQLRHATRFKQMIAKNEQIYLNYFQQMESVKDVTEIKTENVDLEALCFISNDEPTSSHTTAEELIATIKLESISSEALKCKNKKPRLRKPTLKKSTRSAKQKKGDLSKLVERRGNGPILRENSLKILTNSTLCPFQWNKSRYRCFCCDKPFADFKLIKEHSDTHTVEEFRRKIISQQNRMIKVEISSLCCKLCDSHFESLASLKLHLTTAHLVTFDSEEDLLVPFKIEPQLQCQICKEKFRFFRNLNIHVNKHYQKYVCHVCGAGFSNLVFLNVHKTRTHKPNSCKSCDLVFINKTEKRRHEIAAHGVKYERKPRFPCPYCPERFCQENLRIKHQILHHGYQTQEFKCNICFKGFLTLSLCNGHVKNVHMKQKTNECDICQRVFYSKSDVARHMVTHTGEKKYSCDVCHYPFATKDSLRRHVKRTHCSVN